MFRAFNSFLMPAKTLLICNVAFFILSLILATIGYRSKGKGKMLISIALFLFFAGLATTSFYLFIYVAKWIAWAPLIPGLLLLLILRKK
ncbi:MULTISPECIES: hypothetical protein [Aminobacterium]|jgi:CHASE2 domain-containing sensor protein|uniref:hypothetical protein n=2 Tax=Aminobacteriaceae TaxID=3029087 RepID=UPI000462FBD0|nr:MULTISPECIES: hypothetical protein [Aminobacterium]